MTDSSEQQISLEADVLEGSSEGLQITYQTEDGQTVTTLASSADAADIVSKAFTTVADGSDANVEYITMTPEEAAAAGVVDAPEEEQVVTTSLQFDPANPSVLYTADGTPINQADLTPEEQALVQAALQQHLAEQEAEQQLAVMQEGQAAPNDGAAVLEQTPMETETEGNVVTSTSSMQQDEQKSVEPSTSNVQSTDSVLSGAVTTVEGLATITTDATVSSTVDQQQSFQIVQESVDLASPNTSASQIVQSLAENVRKQQIQDKIKMGSPVVIPMKADTPKTTSTDIRYSEKIVIRQGQPQVVKVPVKKPEIPAALANLMPKVEIGKDGSQVIRIHQSQITSTQLKALQDNPNVRLVFRPASKSKQSSAKSQPSSVPKKRGRPRKVDQIPHATTINNAIEEEDLEPDIEEPPTKTTRCGRLLKRPVYTKDYLTPKVTKESEEADDQILDPGDEYFLPKSTSPSSGQKQRGRPPGVKQQKRQNSYTNKIESLRNQDSSDPTAIIQSKPALTPIEQALSTRRKNRLREMLSACSEDEIMEVALPHLARVFSLWEFLVTKVEKNKMARVFFADVYKEYECLHKYVSKLAEKYKQAIEANKSEPETSEAVAATTASDADKATDGENSKKEENETTNADSGTDAKEAQNDSKLVRVVYAKLAESLGLEGTTLQEAEISLLDPEEAIGPRIMGMTGGRRPMAYKHEDKSARKPKAYLTTSGHTQRIEASTKRTIIGTNAAKPIQTEATSTISTIASPTPNASMPPLKPLGQPSKVTTSDNATEAASTPVNGNAEGLVTQTEQDVNQETPMETDASAATSSDTTEATQVTTVAEGDPATSTESGGTQLIQIGQGEDQQFIEVPEGYTLIQTPEGLVMSQPGTTITQGEDGVIYITHADGTTTPLNAAAQQGVPVETVESLLSLDGQQQAQT
uniref:uncharacterized protein LOC120326061 isoform X2 n=1 Tax=Styela clava TaxID=7725 RepID=UPI001939AA2F|nr:uncharacterized protein LOC120326061 isoform X2 [Styela clava]